MIGSLVYNFHCFLYLIFWPFLIKGFLDQEVDLINQLGYNAAFWSVDANPQLNLPHRVLCGILVTSNTLVSDNLFDFVNLTLPGFTTPDVFEKNLNEFLALCWAKIIYFCHSFVTSKLLFMANLVSIFLVLRRILFWMTSVFHKCLVTFVFLIVIVFYLPDDFIDSIVYFVFKVLRHFVLSAIKGEFLPLYWLKWRFTAVFVDLLVYFSVVNSEVRKVYADKLSYEALTLASISRRWSIKAVHFVEALDLPSFIRCAPFTEFSIQNVYSGAQKLRDLGWPINVEIIDVPVASSHNESFKEWLIGGSDFATGIHNMKCRVDKALLALADDTNLYRRTEEYRSLENEVNSIARYFINREYSYPDLPLSDVWFLVSDIFENSQLADFSYIIRKWNKKYALGSFMKAAGVKFVRKYRRQEFIDQIGGLGPLKKLWAATFKVAATILPVSHVHVKEESLPPRKHLQNKVRAIIGAPISQYIMSTVYSYFPDHNFQYQSTPIKIGMPINGYWISKIYERHSRCQIHVEGDCKEFDSTISSGIQELIKDVRKYGYRNHKDFDRICQLIDSNYAILNRQILNTTSTGDIYVKGQGLTTGHASTSMDNSLALIILYLMAWRELTGLSAKEFKFYNELDDYGDDHLLSFLAIRPSAWTASNITKVMSKWGVTNNVKVVNFHEAVFLHKRCRKTTSSDKKHFESLGLTPPPFIVWHDRARLVGKLTAGLKRFNTIYRAKRICSYLHLTAHHPDVYRHLVRVLIKSSSMKRVLRNEGIPIPTYKDVLRNWYKPGNSMDKSLSLPNPDFDPEDEFSASGVHIRYGSCGILEGFIGVLSMAPDFLNPTLFNFGYIKMIQIYLFDSLKWVAELICLTNQVFDTPHLQAILGKTPYMFLEASMFNYQTQSCNFTTLIIRHWIYLWYFRGRTPAKWTMFLTYVISKVSNIQFVINGFVNNNVRSFDSGWDLIIVAALLSNIHVPWDFLEPLEMVLLPDISLLWDLGTNFILSRIWLNLPGNYKEVQNALKAHDYERGPLLIEAPTGSGKSTNMVFHVAIANPLISKVIVLVPRHLLAVGLYDYTKDRYGVPVGCFTEGVVANENARVIYSTVQGLMGHLSIINNHTLFIVDECHIDEPAHLFIKSLLNTCKCRCIYTSATPSEQNRVEASLFLKLATASLYKTSHQIIKVPPLISNRGYYTPNDCLGSYMNWCLNFVKTIRGFDRVLIHFPTIKMVNDFCHRCSTKCAPITSRSVIPSKWDLPVYACTPVADVGITIPNLSHVVTCDIVWDAFSNDFRILDSALIQQRKGRTGRTCNGIFIIVPFEEHLKIQKVSPPIDLDISSVGQLIQSGVKPHLIARVNKQVLFQALGFQASSLSENDMNSILRASTSFLENLRPLMSSMCSSETSPDPSLGENYEIFPAGIGLAQSTLDGGGNLIDDVFPALKFVLARALNKHYVADWEYSLERLSNVSSAYDSVGLLAESIINDIAGEYEYGITPYTRHSGSVKMKAELEAMTEIVSGSALERS